MPWSAAVFAPMLVALTQAGRAARSKERRRKALILPRSWEPFATGNRKARSSRCTVYAKLSTWTVSAPPA